MTSADEIEAQLINDIGGFTHDPLGFVLYAFPWGEPGVLEHEGLRDWQRRYLDDLGQALRKCAATNVWDVIQDATASGHGIGKSALVSWLILWAMATREDTRGVVTANTEGQLRTKTWPEVSKWFGLLICRHWFMLTATAIFSRAKGCDKTWRIDAIPWSESNTEAFAGLHNQGKRILLVFDEGSAISDKIYETAEGALTDINTEIIWACFGNPTRNTGRFRDAFGRLAHRWRTRSIDSRAVEGTNKTQLAKWVADYGEDSDFVRVRVRGMFPSASSMQFIETDTVEQARQREPIAGLRDPLIMSVDVSRGGEDEMVIAFRRGMDSRSVPWVIIPGSETRNSERVVARVVDLATTTDQLRRPDAIIVDETGIGGPIVDRLRVLMGDTCPVFGVQFGAAAPNKKLANMRAHIWWKMRDWLRGGGCVPNSDQLALQLTAPEYFHDRHDRVCLESKDDIKARGLQSDRSDALAISFAYDIQPRSNTAAKRGGTQARAAADYDPYVNI